MIAKMGLKVWLDGGYIEVPATYERVSCPEDNAFLVKPVFDLPGYRVEIQNGRYTAIKEDFDI